MLPRPRMVCNCWSSCSSLTALPFGSTEFGCCAAAGCHDTATATSIKAPTTLRSLARSVVMAIPPNSGSLSTFRRRPFCRTAAETLRSDRLAVRGLPAPGAGAVTALHHPFLVDLRDDVAVAGEQCLG